MRHALLYATVNGVANCTNGVGRQTKTLLSTLDRRFDELTPLVGPFVPHLAIPTPGPATWAYDPEQLADAERIITRRGGHISYLDHDQTAPFWSPQVWSQLSSAAAHAASDLARDYDRIALMAVDTPFLGTGAAYARLARQPMVRRSVSVLLTPYGTAHLHGGGRPDPLRLAWEHTGLAAATRPGVFVADIGDFLTAHLVAQFNVHPDSFVAWRSSLDLTAPDLAPMAHSQAFKIAATFGIPTDRPIVLHVGRTDPVKGFDLLLDALAPLARQVHLVAVIVPFDGDDPVLDEYRRQVATSPVRTTLVPRFTRDLPRALASLPLTRVAVCPSRGETLANLPFEVALWARHDGPVLLAPDRDGFQEQITDDVDGLLYPPDQPGALTAGISRALSLDAGTRARLRHAAYQRVAACRDVVPNLAHTLRSLLGRVATSQAGPSA